MLSIFPAFYFGTSLFQRQHTNRISPCIQMVSEVDIFLTPQTMLSQKENDTLVDSHLQFVRERLDHVARSSLNAFNVSRFGIDLALAEELRNLQDFDEAEKKAKEAIEIALQSKEANNIYVAFAEGILGDIFLAQGYYKEAALKFKSALKSYENHYQSSNGPQELEAIGANQLVSWYFMTTKQFNLATEAIVSELKTIEKVNGLNSSVAADAMLRLGSAHLQNGSLPDAESFFQKALDLYENMYFLHPMYESEEVTLAYLQSLRLVYTGLGNVYYLQGKDRLAEEYYEKVRQSLSFDYFNMAEFASTLQHLAFLKWRAGNLNEATSLLQEVLAALETASDYGPTDYRTVAVKNLLHTLQTSQQFMALEKERDLD